LALDADAAGIKAGLKSALMAIAAGFDVKVPAFPQGQDPADVARENPELLKAAIRTAKTAVEFFLDALRPQAKDERAYKKLAEASVLPLVAAMGSKIEQEHFVALVASRLGVSADAVRVEVAKKPTLSSTDTSSESHPTSAELALTPLQKKAGMLLFKFGRESGVGTKLTELLGDSEVRELERVLEDRAEELRFRFDAEVGEHPEDAIAAEMLADMSRQVERERMRMKFV
jgi:DNA primase